MIKLAYSFSFLLSINIFVWQNVLYFLDAPRIIIIIIIIIIKELSLHIDVGNRKRKFQNPGTKISFPELHEPSQTFSLNSCMKALNCD